MDDTDQQPARAAGHMHRRKKRSSLRREVLSAAIGRNSGNYRQSERTVAGKKSPVCVACKQAVTYHRDAHSMRIFHINGICCDCMDSTGWY